MSSEGGTSTKLRIIKLDGIPHTARNVCVEIAYGTKKLKTTVKSDYFKWDEDFIIQLSELQANRDVKFITWNGDQILGTYSVEVVILMKWLGKPPLSSSDPRRFHPYQPFSDPRRSQKRMSVTTHWK